MRVNSELRVSQDAREDSVVSAKRNSEVTSLARGGLRTITNAEMVSDVEMIIDELDDVLDEIDTSGLPPIRLFEIEDGSVLVEWMLPHHRIGFSIESDRRESGWFLVSDGQAQCIQANGLLSGGNLKRLTAWLVRPVIDYYLS